MAIASGVTVANLYYNQPLLALIGQQFQQPVSAVGWIPMLTQVGYAAGILLFVPLGDRFEHRRLIPVLLIGSAIALALAALAPNLTALAVASLAIGMTTVTSQVVVPFAAQLATPDQQGSVIGRVMSGLFIGILLARTVSGFVGATFGWRMMYWIASGLMLVMAAGLSKILPGSPPSSGLSYPRLMASLWDIVRQHSTLRTTSVIGAMSFGAFSAFWSTLVFLLEQPPYRYGSEVAGLFGLIGVVGALIAPIAGRVADRRSPQLMVRLGILTTTTSFLLFWVGGYQLLGLILGVILLDLGVQATQISNQATIYRLPREVHSRVNALYIMFYFVGGSIGSYLGAFGWSHWQWGGVCALSLAMLTVAILTIVWQERRIFAS